MHPLIKYTLTALVVVVVSEIAKRTGKLGAFIGALPIVGIIVMSWLYFETNDATKVAEYARHTFWYALPGLPAFLVLDALLRQEQKLPVAVGAALAAAVTCFFATVVIARRFGVELLP